MDNIDEYGFRPNVGIVLLKPSQSDQGHQVLWARRIGGADAWQFPQGGIDRGESIRDAVFRELEEEIGLTEASVKVLGQTKDWLHYRLPAQMRRNDSVNGFVGQKQRWFLLQLEGQDTDVKLEASPQPEFDHWRWVSFYYPINQVVDFKRSVYRRALTELAEFLPKGADS